MSKTALDLALTYHHTRQYDGSRVDNVDIEGDKLGSSDVAAALSNSDDDAGIFSIVKPPKLSTVRSMLRKRCTFVTQV